MTLRTRPTHIHRSLRVYTATIIAAASLMFSACGAKQQPVEDHAPTKDIAATYDEVTLPERCNEEACINHNVDSFEVDGIRVIVKREDTPPLAVARIYFEGGAAGWTDENEGHEALALDIVTEGGPASMERQSYHAQLEEVAATIGSSISRDFSSVSLFTPSFALDGTFGLLAQSLLDPAFRDTQIENSRAQQLSSIETRFDDADSATAETTRALAWKDHPYALHPLGEEASVKHASTDALRSAVSDLLKRERMIVVFAGKIDNEEARALVEKHLKDVPHDPSWAEKIHYPDAMQPFSYDRGALKILARADIPTNYILGYFAAPAAGTPDYAAAVIATRLLRNRLFKEVRTKRNLSYAVSSAIANRRANSGALYVTATQPKETLEVMYNTIDDVIEGNITQEDVDNEVRGYLTRYFMGLQSFSAQGHSLAHWTMMTGDRVDADRFIDQLREVTPEQVSEVLERYIRNIQFGVVGNPEQIDREQFEAR